MNVSAHLRRSPLLALIACALLAAPAAAQPVSTVTVQGDSLAVLSRGHGPARIQIAPWAKAVETGAVHLRDGVHPASTSGARLRASLIASATRRCATAPGQGRLLAAARHRGPAGLSRGARSGGT